MVALAAAVFTVGHHVHHGHGVVFRELDDLSLRQVVRTGQSVVVNDGVQQALVFLRDSGKFSDAGGVQGEKDASAAEHFSGDIHSDRHGAIHGHFVLLAVLDDHHGAIAELDGLWSIGSRDTDQNIASPATAVDDHLGSSFGSSLGKKLVGKFSVVGSGVCKRLVAGGFLRFAFASLATLSAFASLTSLASLASLVSRVFLKPRELQHVLHVEFVIIIQSIDQAIPDVVHTFSEVQTFLGQFSRQCSVVFLFRFIDTPGKQWVGRRLVDAGIHLPEDSQPEPIPVVGVEVGEDALHKRLQGSRDGLVCFLAHVVGLAEIPHAFEHRLFGGGHLGFKFFLKHGKFGLQIFNFFFGQIRAGCSASAPFASAPFAAAFSAFATKFPFDLAKTLGDRRIHHGIKVGFGLFTIESILNGVQSFSSVGSDGIRLRLPVLGGRKFHGFSDIEVGEDQEILGFNAHRTAKVPFEAWPGLGPEPFSFSSSSHVLKLQTLAFGEVGVGQIKEFVFRLFQLVAQIAVLGASAAE